MDIYVKPHHDRTKRPNKIKIRAKLKTQTQSVTNQFHWISRFKKGRNSKTLFYPNNKINYIRTQSNTTMYYTHIVRTHYM